MKLNSCFGMYLFYTFQWEAPEAPTEWQNISFSWALMGPMGHHGTPQGTMGGLMMASLLMNGGPTKPPWAPWATRGFLPPWPPIPLPPLASAPQCCTVVLFWVQETSGQLFVPSRHPLAVQRKAPFGCGTARQLCLWHRKPTFGCGTTNEKRIVIKTNQCYTKFM